MPEIVPGFSGNPSAQELCERFRDQEIVKRLLESITQSFPGRPVCLMHVCGTHENALCQFGLRDLLPSWLKLVAGPGCPVCVCPNADLDMAARLALEHGVLLATFGDVVRVPARLSLMEARAHGGDCRVVYGVDDAIRLALDNPKREVVFFAVGFETTACTTAIAISGKVPANFSVLCSHRKVLPALEALLGLADLDLDGFILPGHVLTITGLGDYQKLAERWSIPMATAGFEPLDLLLAIQYLVQRVSQRKVYEQSAGPARPESVFNGYSRLVKPEGNPVALRAIQEVWETVDAKWRGIGTIPQSGWRFRSSGYSAGYSSGQETNQEIDAQKRFSIQPDYTIEDTHPACRCGDVLLGRVEPEKCPLFKVVCHPQNPIGPCMVAFEGTCHARFRHIR
jgi:hydrogenase expression/formation protein HypD